MQEGDWEKEEDKEKAWKALMKVGLMFAQAGKWGGGVS